MHVPVKYKTTYLRNRVRNHERVTRLTNSTPVLPLGSTENPSVDVPPFVFEPLRRNSELTKLSNVEDSRDTADDDDDLAVDVVEGAEVGREKSAGRRFATSWHKTAWSTRTPTTWLS